MPTRASTVCRVPSCPHAEPAPSILSAEARPELSVQCRVTICRDMGTNLPAWKLLGLIAVALALAVPASASASRQTFRSPTGNITCEVSAGGTSGTWVFCQSFRRPQSVRLSPEGEVAFCTTGRDCLRSRPLNPTMRLKYGASVRIGPFRCLSRRYMISCWVVSNRHGFSINLHGIGLTCPRATSADRLPRSLVPALRAVP